LRNWEETNISKVSTVQVLVDKPRWKRGLQNSLDLICKTVVVELSTVKNAVQWMTHSVQSKTVAISLPLILLNKHQPKNGGRYILGANLGDVARVESRDSMGESVI
jgi:hypothetical protein